jgi:hypothetical protein
MNEARRRAYLEAMGYDVWVARGTDDGRSRLFVGPGAGSVLLVCAAPEDSCGKLAADIVRAIGNDPAWAWPDPDGGADCPTVEEAVAGRLFTRLVVFGEDLARALFGGPAPDVLASSAVQVAPGLDELAVRGTAKQALWRLLAGHARRS